jgi:L,D-transpeptidase catalytic domain
MKARGLLAAVVLTASALLSALIVAPGADASVIVDSDAAQTAAAPSSVVAVPLPGAAKVSWHAPTGLTGRTLTSYIVRGTGGQRAAAGASATTAMVQGVSDGWWHAFSVTAVYDDGSQSTSLRSALVATPVLSGWSSQATGGRTKAVLKDAVQVRPAGVWTLQLERRKLHVPTWTSDARTTTAADGTANVKLKLRGGSWQWRLVVVGAGTGSDLAGSYVVASATRGVVASGHPCVWASSGILTAPAKSGSGKRIVWDKSANQVWLVEQSGTVRCSYVVTDNDADTPVGNYQVRSKSAMSSAFTDGRYWRLAHMVRFYLQPGHRLWIGFHAVPQAPNGQLIQPLSSLGKPGYQSHGCVRQHPTNAANLFAFAPVGTKVVVIA